LEKNSIRNLGDGSKRKFLYGEEVFKKCMRPHPAKTLTQLTGKRIARGSKKKSSRGKTKAPQVGENKEEEGRRSKA